MEMIRTFQIGFKNVNGGLTHGQPATDQDIPNSPTVDPFKDFGYEWPNFKRLFYKNIILSVFDPRQAIKLHTNEPEHKGMMPFTQIYVPIEGMDETRRDGNWFFLRKGKAFAGYLVALEEGQTFDVREQTGVTKTPGRAYTGVTPQDVPVGGIGEIAHADDYQNDFELFVNNLKSRTLNWNPNNLTLDYTAKDGTTLSVTYSPESYTTGSQTYSSWQDMADKTEFPYLKSPYASRQFGSSLTTVSIEGKTWTYNWDTAEISEPFLSTDINQSGTIGYQDVIELFNNWGDITSSTPNSRADINGDRKVNGVDFALVLKDWGRIL